ncbi:MAG: ribonuclease III [bacterium]|nr:ribonuclease III [bacterium]
MKSEYTIELLEQNLNYSFKNKAYLIEALSHSSFVNESKSKKNSNERLEFLGDSVLSIIVSEYIFKRYSDLPEGELTKIRAFLVCEKSLCNFSRELELGKFLLLGRGELQNGGNERPSILADAFEAVLAAIYLDSGMEVARRHVLRFIVPELDKSHNEELFNDYKTMLQEIVQRNPEEQLFYTLVGESGPEHDKTFVVEVKINSNVIGRGSGHSKKQAEQQAARQALELMGQTL